MRLICPNCGAQYDVADDAIPPGGRDVQCSNCQVSWFQTEKPTVPGRDTSLLITPRQPTPAEAAVIAEAEPEPVAPVEAAPEPTADAPTDAAPASPAEASPAEASPAEAEPQRRPLDDAVASILREEAALSTPPAAASESPPASPVASPAASPVSSPVATPPATEPAKSAENVTIDETRQRIAQMTAEEGGTPTMAAAAVAPSSASADKAHQRTVPSINEINATLRARAQANDASGLTEAEKQEAVQRKGFRRGFFWVLIILAILILPYVFAEQITENLPQTRGFMASYVMTVDQVRLTLREVISGFRAG